MYLNYSTNSTPGETEAGELPEAILDGIVSYTKLYLKTNNK